VSSASNAPSTKISKNIEKVARSLFDDEGTQQRFLQAIERGESGVTGVVWLRGEPQIAAFATGERPEWLPEWIDVAAETERPGKLKAHDEGAIYCMDLSSTFACSALSAINEPVQVIVDVCASPGGKGIVARRYFEPGLLVGNEVIGKRTAQLISNYKRCNIDPSIVTSLDPQQLGAEIPQSADLVIVDAPCSGQSLVLKGMAAPGAFHPATIGMNERRQRRILAHSSKVVAPGGYLLYATCTFSREENEDNVMWLLKNFPEFSAVSVPVLEPYRSHLSDAPTYRLLPHLGKGAGAFCALLQRAAQEGRYDRESAQSVTTQLRASWRSPTLFVSRDPGTGQGTSRYKKRNDDKGKRAERYERQKTKRMLRNFE
jgi:16S rRNA C967 or C1407 C5-methylase (RsmB/RsmF family)